MKRLITVAVVVMMIMAIAVPVMAAGHDKAGNSNVWQCDLVEGPDYDDYGWGKVMFKDNGDGTIDYVLTGHDLMARTEYEIRSGGSLDPEVTGYTNKGGNLLLKGTMDPGGARLNLWELGDPDARLLYTDMATCTIP
ncbi:MAG: hypothetical protein KJP12_01980 [Acidimicrobiia bacterium]|nr:hypothetical protein [Acidimicrobiia bacterium]